MREGAISSNILRARLAQLPGGALDLTPAQVQRVREAPSPSNEQLQAVLGTEGTRTYQWWKTGLDRAVGVAAVRARLGGRIGTGFLVRGAATWGCPPPTSYSS